MSENIGAFSRRSEPLAWRYVLTLSLSENVVVLGSVVDAALADSERYQPYSTSVCDRLIIQGRSTDALLQSAAVAEFRNFAAPIVERLGVLSCTPPRLEIMPYDEVWPTTLLEIQQLTD
ncbi:MAG: hypothetical protein AAF413_01735 [Patescibacteria group bacterium]